MDDHLGVGIGRENKTLLGLLLAQYLMVFDDAIVDNRHLIAADVRMGVTLGGLVVRRPASVRDAGASGYRPPVKGISQFNDFSGGANPIQFGAIVQNHQTGGIITPVFETLQPFQQYGRDLALCNSPYNSTHRFTPLFQPLPGPSK